MASGLALYHLSFQSSPVISLKGCSVVGRLKRWFYFAPDTVIFTDSTSFSGLSAIIIMIIIIITVI